MENNLTNRAYWENYWKRYEYEKIPDKVIYQSYLKKVNDAKSFIEIGGFPGINAAFFFRNICRDVSLLDFYIDKDIVHNLEKHNSLPADSIQCIEADFFGFKPDKKYDIVFSLGFIEHFEDTGDVLERHIRFLSENGKLLVILPNFRGLNGFLQRIADKKNFDAHNLESMKISRLKHILSTLPVENVEVSYTRKCMLWLEPRKGFTYKIIRPVVKIFSHLLKVFPFKCRLLSPYIILFATKKK